MNTAASRTGFIFALIGACSNCGSSPPAVATDAQPVEAGDDGDVILGQAPDAAAPDAPEDTLEESTAPDGAARDASVSDADVTMTVSGRVVAG